MSVSDYLTKAKEVQEALLNLFEDEENAEINFENLFSKLDNYNIKNDKKEFKIFLSLLSTISDNHYRKYDFFKKIEEILQNMQEVIKKYFTNSEIFDIFKDNKRIILFLVESGIILNDDSFMEQVMVQNKFYPNYFNYFYQNMMDDAPDNFKENQKIGENESYLCSLIRQDLAEDFISHVNRKNISLKSKIKPSVFETNTFLNSKMPSLIEYAAFFGSIQIFQYLILNKVELTESLWIYAIHGNHPEMIHLIEEYQIVPPNNDFNLCFKESIICHHIDLANYILDRYLQHQVSNANEIIKYSNFLLIDENLIDAFYIYYLCENNYYTFVELILKEKEIDINKQIISIISNLIAFFF